MASDVVPYGEDHMVGNVGGLKFGEFSYLLHVLTRALWVESKLWWVSIWRFLRLPNPPIFPAWRVCLVH